MNDWTILPRLRRDILGEGITYNAQEGSLYWVDILGQRVNKYDLATNAYHEWGMPDLIGWIIPRAAGGFLAGLRSGFHRLELDGLARVSAVPSPVIPNGHRLNDASTDHLGRIWAGSMGMAEDGHSGALFRLDPDGQWQELDAPYRIANGPAHSLDGRLLYHADSARGLVYQMSVHDDGSLGPRAVHITFPSEWGSPDGMTIDAEDGLWLAHWGAGCVSRFDPDGRRERVIRVPASQVTRPCFAGERFDRLFVTSASVGVDEPLAGAVFEVAPGVRGVPQKPFAG